MLTLSFGYKKPQTNDKAAVVFPALELNFQKLNDHTHDGINSARVPSASLQSTVVDVSAVGWGADLGNGIYTQSVNAPAGYSYDLGTVEVRLSTMERIYPKITRVSAGQILIWSNNPAVAMKVFFN